VALQCGRKHREPTLVRDRKQRPPDGRRHQITAAIRAVVDDAASAR
jgi:hypothetical protein